MDERYNLEVESIGFHYCMSRGEGNVGSVKNGSPVSGWSKWIDEGVVHQDLDCLGEGRFEERKR